MPIASQPSYHSKPGAVNRIYLDFNGATVTNTAWNNGTVANPLICPPFDLDDEPTTFNDAEQTVILGVWQRVAEDYAPFNVDVTTDSAAMEGSLNNVTGHVVITKDSIGVAPGRGGIAYIGAFGRPDYASTYSPAFVLYDNLASNESYIAEACAHEMGHNVGLSHDATNNQPSGYYRGHGSGPTSWAPIMGGGFDRDVSQFSKGEYFNANNTLQDDLTIIASYLSYRADDFGNSAATATDISGSTLNATGIIGQTSDVDVVSFSCGAGPLTLNVATWLSPENTNGGNLDVKLSLYNASGSLVTAAAPAGAVNAGISTTVTAGTYFLYIANDGEGSPLVASPTGYTSYGSLGRWTLTGSTATTVIATIAASTSAASEAGPTAGMFTITMTPPLTNDTTVAYAISGSATNGTDYQTITASVLLPADAPSTTITVTPIVDVLREGNETVTLTISPNTSYVVGSASSATVTITDDPPAGGTTTSTTAAGTTTTSGTTSTSTTASPGGDSGGSSGGMCGAGSLALILAFSLTGLLVRRRR